MVDSARIGVTGAAGYIGSRVAAVFSERGHDIVPIDNFHEGDLEAVHGESIREVDVRDRKSLREALDDVDAVMHLAAITGVPESEENPELAFDVNVIGTQNVAWLCREWGLPMVFPASMAIIGEPVEFPIGNDHPRAPVNHYGRTKKMSEDDIRSLAADSFPALIFMKSNLYGHHHIDGKRVGKRTVINIFVERAMSRDPLTVHEPGTQARDFIHVNDVARAYIDAFDMLRNGSTGARTVPLASGESCSIREIAESVQGVVEEELGETVPIEMVENPRDAEAVANDFTVETETAKELIGFEAERSIEETVREMVQS